MSANRSTASSARALQRSLSAFKQGSGGSETALASILTERHSHSLPAPLTAGNDTLHGDDRPSHDQGSEYTPMDEPQLLGYSTGDRSAPLRRSTAAASTSRGRMGTAMSCLTNTSLASNSMLQVSAVSAPLDFMGSTTWGGASQSRAGGHALRSGQSSTVYRVGRPSMRQYGGYDNQRSFSTFERTVSSILPAGFSGSMFPQRDGDGNVIHDGD
jgi:hypothetical protein